MPVSDEMIAALIALERTGEEGLVAQLTGQLRRLIAAGRLAKGRALPSSRRLASELGVSRNTVSFAFEQLAAEGYLEMSHGRRPVVAADSAEAIDKASVVRSRVKQVRPRLSPWAMHLRETDWPMSYLAPLRPLRPGHGDAREFPNEI